MTTKPKRQKSALAAPQPDVDDFAEIKKLLQAKLQEFYIQDSREGEAE